MPDALVHNREVSGMLRAFQFIRSGVEDRTIRSASESELAAFLTVLLCRDEPIWNDAAVDLMSYKRMRPTVPSVDTALWLETGRITPYHCMGRERLTLSLHRINARIDVEHLADEFMAWHEKNSLVEHVSLAATPDAVYRHFLAENTNLAKRDERYIAFEVRDSFLKDPQTEQAEKIISNFYQFEPGLVYKAFRILQDDPSIKNAAFQLVDRVSKNSPQDFSGFYDCPNEAIFVQHRAECLLNAYSDLQKNEANEKDHLARQKFNISVVVPLLSFLQKSESIVAKYNN